MTTDYFRNQTILQKTGEQLETIDSTLKVNLKVETVELMLKELTFTIECINMRANFNILSFLTSKNIIRCHFVS